MFIFHWTFLQECNIHFLVRLICNFLDVLKFPLIFITILILLEKILFKDVPNGLVLWYLTFDLYLL